MSWQSIDRKVERWHESTKVAIFAASSCTRRIGYGYLICQNCCSMSFEIGGEYDAASKGFQHVNHIEMNDITIFLFVPAPSSGWCAKPLFKVAKNGTENFSHPIWHPDSTPGVHISESKKSRRVEVLHVGDMAYDFDSDNGRSKSPGLWCDVEIRGSFLVWRNDDFRYFYPNRSVRGILRFRGSDKLRSPSPATYRYAVRLQ